MASTERLQVVLDAVNNTAGAFKGVRGQIAKTQLKMQQMGRKMQRMGTQMTQFISVPLAAAGAAATKFAADFEENLKQTRSQIDATAKEAQKIGDAVEDIAVRTGKATDEIFKAMRIAQSSTLGLAEANDLVEGAALGAASGLGKMKTLVNLGTTAANKFGDSVDSARRGMEVMAAAAQQSETSVDQFAGGLLKGSSGMEQLGISMQEGAAIFSRLSSSARNAKAAGTQFRAFLTKLAKPTKDMTGLMADVFGGVQDFRKEMNKNAIGTLFRLREAMEESNKTTATFLGSVRAVGGASNLFASNLEDVQKTLKKTKDSQGLLLEMFRASASFTRLLSRAFQALKKALRPIGDVIIKQLSGPLSKFITKAKEFAEWFEGLPAKKKKMVVFGAAIVAALGPVIAILGTMSILLGSITTTTVLATAAMGGLVGLGLLLVKHWDEVVKIFEDVKSKLKEAGVISDAKEKWESFQKFVKNRLIPAMIRLGKWVIKASKTVSRWAVTAFDALVTATKTVVGWIKQFWGWIKKVFNQFINMPGVRLLINSMRNLGMVISEDLIPALKRFWQKHGPGVKEAFRIIGNFLKSVLIVAFRSLWWIIKQVFSLFKFIGKLLINTVAAAFGVAANAVNGVIFVISKLVDWFTTFVTFIEESVIPGVNNFANNALDWLVSQFSSLVDNIKSAVEWFGDLIEKIENFLSLEDKLPDWAVEGVGGSLPDFFDVSGSFDSGGVVPGPVGQPRLAKVHAGETILPTHKQGFASGGGNVNITINGDVSGREVIEKVKQGLMSDLGRETKVSLQ